MNESEFTALRERFHAQIKTWDVHSTVKLMLQRMLMKAKYMDQARAKDGELHFHVSARGLGWLIDRAPSTVSKYIRELESKGYLESHGRNFYGLRHISLRLQGSEG